MLELTRLEEWVHGSFHRSVDIRRLSGPTARWRIVLQDKGSKVDLEGLGGFATITHAALDSIEIAVKKLG